MEPEIIINGIRLIEAQAMTVRCAVNSFIIDLQNNGLGDDEHGKAMARAYLARLREITEIMHNKEDAAVLAECRFCDHMYDQNTQKIACPHSKKHG
jgi:hypothetical protein